MSDKPQSKIELGPGTSRLTNLIHERSNVTERRRTASPGSDAKTSDNLGFAAITAPRTAFASLDVGIGALTGPAQAHGVPHALAIGGATYALEGFETGAISQIDLRSSLADTTSRIPQTADTAVRPRAISTGGPVATSQGMSVGAVPFSPTTSRAGAVSTAPAASATSTPSAAAQDDAAAGTLPPTAQPNPIGPDAPALAVVPASGLEDQPIGLVISAQLTDATETLSVVIAGVPNGATLSAGTQNPDGTWSLTPSQLNGLTITPPHDFGGTINLMVTAISTDGTLNAVVSAGLTVTVTPVADLPSLSTLPATGLEDLPIPLVIAAGISDPSETLSLMISGVPVGATLSAGTNNGDGSWTLTPQQLAGLSLTPPLNFKGGLDLTVTATAKDGADTASTSSGLRVSVIGVPDLPNLAALPAVGLEDLPIPLAIVAGLADLTETLSITIAGVPSGATLSAGIDNGDGTWTLDQGQLAGLTLTAPHNFNGSIGLTVTAASTDGSDSVSISAPLPVTVISVPDLPTLATLPAVGLEDLPIPLAIVAGLSDPTETLSLIISGVPAGATLSAGIDNGDGTWTLSQAQLLGLSLTPPRDFDGQINLTVTATSADGSDIASTSATLGVTVIGVPDLPTLATLPALGLEDAPIPLVIAAGLTDLSETLTVTISGVPNGATLSAGTNNGDGTWTLSQGQLPGLTFTAAQNFHGNISLTVTATSADGPDSIATSSSLDVTVISVPDLPNLSALPAVGLEDAPIPLVIVASLADLSETLSVTIGGVPGGATLSAGVNNGDGTWTLTQAQLLGLTLTAPQDFKGTIGLTVTATSADGSDTASATASLGVTVIGVPDLPTLSALPATGLEDLPISLVVVAGLSDLTEVLSITIAGVPAGALLSAGIDNGNGTWTLTQAELAGLTLTPPQDFKGNIGLTVTATSADGSDSVSTSTPLDVSVIGVSDLPNLTTLPALGLEDLPIPLAIVAGLTDLTETLSITIAGIPIGAALSAGTNNGNGTWTLTPGQLSGLTLTAPQDFKGTIGLTVTATSVDGSDSTSTSAPLTVTVVGVPDLPNLATLPAAGLEDLPIPLVIVAGLTDLSETLSITISGVPHGATLSAGTSNGDGSWTLTQAQLAGLTLTAPQDFKGNIDLTVTAASADGSDTAATSASLAVTVVGVPDLPNLTTLPAVGLEDQPISLAIVAGLTDISETLSLTIFGVPAGATLSAGTDNGGGSWTLTQAQLVGLTLTAPQDFKGTIALTVTATSADGADTTSTSAALNVTVIGVPDLPNLATLPALGLEDLPVPLAIVAGLGDLTEALSVTVAGVPTGASLSAGIDNGNGTWTLTQGELVGLTLSAPQDFKGNISLTITATSTDGADSVSTSANLDVTVVGVADLPHLATLPAVGLEDLPIPLAIVAGLTDLTETLSVTIAGVPAGASLSAGIDNGNGSWTLTQGQLTGLTLTAPQDFKGNISLTITATSTDGADSVTASANLDVVVVGVPDAPSLATLPAVGLEDLPIPLGIIANLSDPTETLSIIVSGVPAGAVLSAGTNNGNGSWTLTQGQLPGLTLTPPQDFNGTISLTITAVSSDGGNSASSSAGIDVTVIGVPDLPTLTTLPALGLEDLPIPLAIVAGINDPAETLSVTVSGVPSGAVLSAGIDNGDGSWTLTQAQLIGLTLTAPTDFHGTINLTVTATASDGQTTAQSSAGLTVSVASVPDLPSLVTLPALGLEDMPVALAIAAFSTDPTETLSITVSGIPAGATLSAGQDNGDGTWTLTQGQLAGLTLTPPQDFKGTLSLGVTATSTENGQSVSAAAALQVTVAGVPDVPTLITLPAAGLEDQPILLAIAAGLTDPSETLSVTIAGLPAGASLSAGHNNGNGTWTLTSPQLLGLTLTPPNDFHGSFNLTVTATSAENGQSISTSATLGVSVASLPDLPTLVALPAAGLEDLPVALVITAGLTDPSETLSITIAGVPAGASLSAGRNNGDGTWTLTPLQLVGLSLAPAQDFKGTIALTVSATSSDGTGTETASVPLYVNVVGVPDLPTLTALPAVGLEDVPVALLISAGLTDPTETLSVTIAGVPAGASLSAGHNNGDGSWTLSPAQLVGLTLTPPRDFHGQFALNVTAISTDGGSSISASTSLGVSIASVPDLPTLLTLPAIGLEDQPIALQLTAALADLSETLTITISGVPAGAVLSAGVSNGNGSWTIAPSQIAGLTLTPPHDYKGQFALTVTATASDGTNSVSLQASLAVTVVSVPDLPNLVTLPALGIEDLPVALVIAAGLTDPDDTLSVTIAGLPTGSTLSAGTRNADGSWTLAPGQLTGLLLTPPQDFKGVIGLTVTANSTDGSTVTSTSSHLAVTVIGVADAPVLAVLPAVGLPNAPVALVITALAVDITEQLSISIGGLPAGASLSAGTDNGDGTWTLTPLQLVGLTLNPPSNFQGNIALQVVATSEDGSDTASTSASLGVTVGLNLSAPSLSVATATGAEDNAIALSINAALTNPAETLGLTITGVPAGASLSAGTRNADGSWTLTKAQLTGLTLTPPANFSGALLLTVTATSAGVLGNSTSVSALNVHVTPVADAPLLAVAPAMGLEDRSIALSIQSSVTDTSETLSVTIAGVPAGAALSAGVRNANGTWSLTAAQLTGLTLTPPANFKGSLNLTVTATSTDGPSTATASSTLAVTVGAVADAPTLTTVPAVGLEDRPIALAISSALTDPSETLSVTISGIPAGAVLSAGVNNGNGSWTLTSAQLAGLMLTPPTNFKGAINLTVTATATDGTDQATTTAPLIVTVSGVADTPSLSLQPAYGLEDQAIALDVTAALTDPSETLSVTIAGVPSGAMLSAGLNNGNGSWTLTPGQLAGLTLTPPVNYKGLLNLTVTATAADGGDLASISGTLAVSVAGVADTPLLSVAPAAGLEDQPIALAIAAALNDPSETLSITVSGIPAGALLSAGRDNGDGSWTLTPGQLAGLTLTPAPDFKGSLQLTVTARSSDGADHASVTAPLAVTVTAQADAPTLTVAPAIGLEDQTIALNIAAGLTDPTETLSITLTGIPAGGILSAGFDNGDGTWTLTPAQLAGLTLTPPENFKGTLLLMVTATSSDGGNSASTSAPLDISVSGVADLPTLSVLSAQAAEGEAIALSIAAGLSDSSEMLSISVAGIPAGATLSAGTKNGDGTWTLTPGQLAGLTMVPAANFKGTIALTVTATSVDGTDSASISLPLHVTVDAVANAPTLSVAPATGLEDQPIALVISAALTDPTEILTVILAGVPAGALLSAGTDNGNGSWTLTADELAGLTLTPPTDFKGQINLSVTATAADGTQYAHTTASLGITVAGTADAPLLAVAPASGHEDQPVALIISAATQDASEALSIEISGLPAGAALSAGMRNADGTWTLTPAQLAGLTLTPPADFKGTLALVVTAISTDGGDEARTSTGLNVAFTSVADAPTLVTQPASGLEGAPIALSIAATLTDASETLSVTIAGIPAGAALSRGQDNGDGTWTVAPSDLTGLALIPPQHFKGTISLVVTASSTDGSEQAQTSAGLAVVIGAVADTPSLTVAAATGLEDSPIALAISAGLQDPTEVLAITISGVPAGASLSAGIDNGDGSWQLLPSELTGLTLTPPQDFKGTLNLVVTATATDGASSTSVSSPLAIDISGTADAPNLLVNPSVALEGQPIPLDITASLNDPTESLGITISGMPLGATLSAGTQNPDGSWSLTPAQLAGLVLTPPPFFNGTLQLDITATSTDGADHTSLSLPLAITIGEVADAPLLSVAPATGLEGQPIALDIAASLVDPSETLSIVVSGVPAGATLSAGTRNPDGTWSLAPSDLAGLSLTLDPNFRGTLALTVTATSSDGSGSTDTSAVLPLVIEAVASTPTLTLSPAIGLEDQVIPLSIVASSSDPAETVSVVVSGLPAGTQLSAGTNNGDGSWTLSPQELAGLTLTPPSNFKGVINLIVTATSTDGSEQASLALPLAITVGAVADAPSVAAGNVSGLEDHSIALSLSAALVDPTETLSLTISGLPAGATLSAGTRNADGSWTVAPGDLTNLQLTPPVDFKGSLALTLTAVSTDGTEQATSSATFSVEVGAVADAPTLLVTSATGLEDQAIPLAISAALTDASEALSIVIAGVPAGAVLSAGSRNADGTWTLTPLQLTGLTLTPPQDFKGSLSLTVTATSTDGSDVTSVSANLGVTVQGVADAPTLTALPAAGLEGQPIALAISADLTDASETLSIAITGLPAGATLSAGMRNSDGSWTLTPADLAGLTLMPPAHFKGNIGLTVTATSSDGSEQASTSAGVAVTVAAVADTPTLATLPALGLESQPVALGITASLADASETLGISIAGVPADATLSAGVRNADGTWTLTPAQLAGLTLTPPAHFKGDINLTVTATSTDGAEQASVSAGIHVTVTSVADTPTLSTLPALGLEGQPIALGITAGLTDSSESLSVSITGVPVGAILSAGTRNADGSWSLTPVELAGLTLTPPAHFKGDLNLIVTATSTDGSNNASVSTGLSVSVHAVADTPTLSTLPAVGLEGQPIALGIAASLADTSETLSLAITGVPADATLSAGTRNADGSWTLTPAQLVGLSLTPSANFKGDIALTVTATSTDGTSQASISAGLQVSVGAVADTPSLSTLPALGLEGQPIALGITAGLTDSSETLALTVSGVPATAMLSAGTRNADGSWSLTPAQLTGLTLLPAPHFKGAINLTVTATSTDGSDQTSVSAALNVTVAAVADAPTLSTLPALGLEDQPITLGITAGLADSSETLGITINGVPSGATLSAGTRNSDGSWSLTPAQLAGLTLTPAANFKGSIALTVTATSVDGAQQASTSAGLNVTVAAVADTPTLATLPALGLEGQPVALGITAALADVSETLGVTISGVPSGATLSAGTRNADGSWSLTPAQLTGLTLTPAAHFKGAIGLTVTATSTDGSQQASISAGLNVTVAAVADAPTLATLPAVGLEGQAVSLGITAGLTDASEVLGLTITGVPAGGSLSAGTRNADGSWTLTPAQLAGLTLTPPAHFKGTIGLTVTATSTDGAAQASVSSGLAVTITPVADVPTLATLPALGLEDRPIALGITAGLTDASETLGLTITGVPTGAMLSAGTRNADGSWTLTPAQLTGLTLTPPANFKGTIGLTVTATSTDGSQHTSISTGLAVTVTPVADTPTLTALPAVGLEGQAVSLGINAALTDISETLGVTITGVPSAATLSAGTRNADGSWSLTPAQLSGLTLIPTADFKGVIGLTVTATSTDGSQKASISTGLNVTIAAVADTPSLSLGAVTGREGGTIGLNIAAASTDTSGSEVVSVLISGVPAGSHLSAGTYAGNNTWSLTKEQLAGLTITPPATFSGNLNLSVTATSREDNGSHTSLSSNYVIPVAPVADAPVLTVGTVRGLEDTAIALDIGLAIKGNDASETLGLVTISGVPTGATLSAGTQTGANTWTVTAAQLVGLKLTPALNDSNDFTLTVTARSVESDGSIATTTGSLSVIVEGVADTPTSVTAGNVAGVSGSALPLSISPAAVTDGSETLTYVVSGIPDGFALSRGTNNGDNTWTLQPGDLASVSLVSPPSFQGQLKLYVTPVSHETDGIGTAAGVPASFLARVGNYASGLQIDLGLGVQLGGIGIGVQVTAGINLDLFPATGGLLATNGVYMREDSSYVLQDAPSLLGLPVLNGLTGLISRVILSGLPSDATLSAGVNKGGGVWELTQAQLTGLTLTTGPNSDTNFTIVSSVRLISLVVINLTSTPVNVVGIADTPTLAVSAVAGTEDGSIPLTITGALGDNDGSEALSYLVSGMPAGFTLSAGTNNGNGTWSLTAAQVVGLTVIPARNYSGTAAIKVSAIATEREGDQTVVQQTVNLTVAAVADAPSIGTSLISGVEDTAIALNFNVSLKDTDGSESISGLVISGLPAGATLINATSLGNGSWSVDAANINNVSLVPPAHFSGDFNLSVTAISREASNASTAQTTTTVPVHIEATATVPSLTVSDSSGYADSTIPINIGAHLVDTDGSERLSVIISGVPSDAHLSAGTFNPDGSWTLTSGQLTGLTMTPGATVGHINLSVTAISQEQSNGLDASITQSIGITVSPAPQMMSLSFSDSAFMMALDSLQDPINAFGVMSTGSDLMSADYHLAAAASLDAAQAEFNLSSGYGHGAATPATQETQQSDVPVVDPALALLPDIQHKGFQ